MKGLSEAAVKHDCLLLIGALYIGGSTIAQHALAVALMDNREDVSHDKETGYIRIHFAVRPEVGNKSGRDFDIGRRTLVGGGAGN